MRHPLAQQHTLHAPIITEMQWKYIMFRNNKNPSMQQLLRGKIRGTSLHQDK